MTSSHQLPLPCGNEAELWNDWALVFLRAIQLHAKNLGWADHGKTATPNEQHSVLAPPLGIVNQLSNDAEDDSQHQTGASWSVEIYRSSSLGIPGVVYGGFVVFWLKTHWQVATVKQDS